MEDKIDFMKQSDEFVSNNKKMSFKKKAYIAMVSNKKIMITVNLLGMTFISIGIVSTVNWFINLILK